MTEPEWLVSADSYEMLRFLIDYSMCSSNQSSERKFRLFSCACVRQVWHLLTDPEERDTKAVRTSEKFAYFSTDSIILEASRTEAWAESMRQRRMHHAALREATLAAAMTAKKIIKLGTALEISKAVVRAATLSGPGNTQRAKQADILRDIIGNPCRRGRCSLNGRTSAQVLQEQQRAVAGGCCDRFANQQACECLELSGEILPEWLTPTVLSLAHAVIDERLANGVLDPVRLAILADSLEEAGCPPEVPCLHCNGTGWFYEESCRACACRAVRRVSPSVLAHLHMPVEHYLGCWAVDLILGY